MDRHVIDQLPVLDSWMGRRILNVVYVEDIAIGHFHTGFRRQGLNIETYFRRGATELFCKHYRLFRDKSRAVFPHMARSSALLANAIAHRVEKHGLIWQLNLRVLRKIEVAINANLGYALIRKTRCG